MTENNKEKYSGLVIDLKRMRSENQRPQQVEAASAEIRKRSSASKRPRGLFAFKEKKKDKDINFLDSDILSSLDELNHIEDELRQDLGGEYSAKRSNPAIEALKLVFRLPYHFFWLVLFLVRFIWFFFVRIFKVASFRRISKRPKFGQTEGYVPKKTSSPFSFIRSVFSRQEDDHLIQEKLFEEIKNKNISPAKQALSFAALALVLILPFKALSYYQTIKVDDLEGKVMGAAEQAIGDLKAAGGAIGDKKMDDASVGFSRAGDSFRRARMELEAVDDTLLRLARFIPDDKVRLASISKEMLALGELSSSMGANLSLAFDGFLDKTEDEEFTGVVDNFLEYEKKALDDSKQINKILASIDSKALPKEYREIFSFLVEKSADLEMTLAEIYALVDKMRVFLGFEMDKRYLFVFQNNNEARATGGFIGSYALVDFSKGKIKKMETPAGGSYDTEGGLMTSVVAPEPLHLVDPMWHFWDANWWPDWEKSAKKLSWFYEKSGGPTVDGVIGITPNVLEDLLRITGPIDMTESNGLIMNADNFWTQIREQIEKEKIEDVGLKSELAENKPKKIIGEFFSKLIAELPKHLNKDSMISFLSMAEDNLEEKHIIFYFKDEKLQSEVEDRGWAGKIKDTNKDYLMVVNTNIAGGKSDKRMRQEIEHNVEIDEDGTVVDTLTITRTHTGVKDEPFYGVRNVNWMRIYVPSGSKLLEAAGFRGPDPVYFEDPDTSWEEDPDVLAEEESFFIDRDNQNTYVYEESGKTVFANWSMIDPGTSREIYLKYELPFKLEKKEIKTEDEDKLEKIIDKIMKVEKKPLYAYSLYVQKQPGSRFVDIDSKLDAADVFAPVWGYPEQDQGSGNLFWNNKESLDRDKYWAVVMEREDQ
ncbi:DUF4012 domain-containing protein [Candidatus Falkowbacteria bacterium]|nr:DUF4012 domain-containing protein [Candidatus Falkowbacteria bacterium]